MAMMVEIARMIVICELVSSNREVSQIVGELTHMCAKWTLFDVTQYVPTARLIAVATQSIRLIGTHWRTPKVRV